MNLRALLFFALLTPLAAYAAPIPAPIADMIHAASGDDATLTAIVTTAKKTNPDSIAEIDALVAQLKSDAAAKHEAELAQRDVFDGWKGQGEAGLSNSTGNSSETAAALGLHFTRVGLQWDHAIDTTADYSRADGVTTKSRYFAGYNTRYKFDDSLYATGLVSWENNRFAGFSRRLTESLGVGYTIINNPDLLLAVEAGPALRQTTYIDGTSDSNLAARLALRNRWLILPNLTFTENFAYLYSSQNSTITSDTALTATLTGKLSARLSYHIQNESNPPDGLENTDTLTRLTLVYSF
jgi:putative salt-induced outer membrane protein